MQLTLLIHSCACMSAADAYVMYNAAWLPGQSTLSFEHTNMVLVALTIKHLHLFPAVSEGCQDMGEGRRSHFRPGEQSAH